MPIKMPSEQQLRQFGPQKFPSEGALQRFVEQEVLPACGLRVVTSSEAGGPRLGGIDTLAIDVAGTPVIFEHKRGDVNRKAREQLARYEQWALTHRERVGKAISAKWEGQDIKWGQLCLVLLGYRYTPKKPWAHPSSSEIQLLRYGYNQDGTVFVREVDPQDVRTFGDDPVPAFSKAEAIKRHQAKTTDAGRAAFDILSRELRNSGFQERFPGKNRVWYRSGEHLRAEVTFLQVGLQVFFRLDGDLKDTEGRVAPSKKKLGWTIGILSPADVPYVIALLRR